MLLLKVKSVDSILLFCFIISGKRDAILNSTSFSLETPKGQLANNADLDNTPKNAASDQGLHGLQIVKPFSLGIK